MSICSKSSLIFTRMHTNTLKISCIQKYVQWILTFQLFHFIVKSLYDGFSIVKQGSVYNKLITLQWTCDCCQQDLMGDKISQSVMQIEMFGIFLASSSIFDIMTVYCEKE